MSLDNLNVLLAQGAGGATQQNPTASAIMMVAWVAMLVGMFYFMAIRPQQKRTRDLNNLLKGLRKGDKIVTNSGIVGTVVSVKEKTIALRSEETKLEVLKSAVAEVTERSSESAE